MGLRPKISDADQSYFQLCGRLDATLLQLLQLLLQLFPLRLQLGDLRNVLITPFHHDHEPLHVLRMETEDQVRPRHLKNEEKCCKHLPED